MHKVSVAQLIQTSGRDMAAAFFYTTDRPYEFDLTIAMTAADVRVQAALLDKVHRKYPDKWEAAYLLFTKTGLPALMEEAFHRIPYVDNYSDMEVYHWRLYDALVQRADSLQNRDLATKAAMRVLISPAAPEEARSRAHAHLELVGMADVDLTFSNEVPLSRIDKVLFINLDSRPDRRAATEAALADLGFPADKVERVPGVPHPIGGLGCSTAHHRCMELAIERGYSTVLILEDDFQPDVSRREFWESLDRLFREGTRFDVAMLAYNLIESEAHPAGFVGYARKAAAGSAYLVSKEFLPTLAQCVKDGIAMFEETRSYDYTIDVQWMGLQRTSEWLYFKRRLSVQRSDFSNIVNNHVNYGV